ncbi:transcription elongation factor GreA [Candidatus Peregrinibacteria bacterium]|nr:MAG: transcription elongation factor GreA [Candidatus Peregrinibacteria bacterium]
MSTPNTEEQVLVTKEGLAKLKDELNLFKNVRRKEVAERLKEAISYGDLSENSEYEEAKNEQAFIEGRIIELEKMIDNAIIITDAKKKSEDVVQIGSTVTVQNLTEKDDPETYTIVGSTEAGPADQKISNESPIGSALLGRAKNDVIKVKVPQEFLNTKSFTLNNVLKTVNESVHQERSRFFVNLMLSYRAEIC